MAYIHRVDSPLGGITLASDGEALTGLWFDGQKFFGATLVGGEEARALAVFGQAEAWLNSYFSGRRPDFTPPVAMRGTTFQRAVWAALTAIPYGETATYGEIARRVATQMGALRVSARAAGGAVGRNPIALIVPCHRVVGANGSLTGYAGGLERKARLLALERGARVCF